MQKCVFALFLCFSLMVVGSAGAAEVTDSGLLGANDSIGWGQLGPTGTVLTPTVTVTSGGGLTAVVSGAGGTLERLDQEAGWAGNFTQGDQLLWTNLANGPITIIFNTPVSGAGAQIQADDYGDFTATLNVYGAGGLLESYSLAGTSNGNNDGSAIFLGVLDGTADITEIQYSVSTGGDDFAINELGLVTGGASPVPEPCTVILLGSGLAGLAAFRKKFKNA
jgi:hypothetical protein